MFRISITVLAFCAGGLVQAQSLSKQEIARRGTESTALALAGSARAAAFCVHRGGYFVTLAQSVKGSERDEIRLVLNSNQANQRVHAARVVRIDANLNLALLYCVDAKNAKSLPLGAIDGVHELIELYTFGFPVAPGRPSESEFPAIQVQVGTVSALQRKGGQVNRVQLGVLANPSGSGGPVLDASGKVVGMVDSGEGPARAARADFGTRSAREI